MKRDNSALLLKATLRRNLLQCLEKPVVMETNAGHGTLWSKCYFSLQSGVALEKDSFRASEIARQRPTWAVYECDNLVALRGGIGRETPINFVDIDPYGAPWPIVDAFFESERPFPERLAMAVTDGLRQSLMMNSGWHLADLEAMVQKYGNTALFKHYLEICQELLAQKASQRGYALAQWAGRYAGLKDQMSYYAALFIRK